MRVNENQMPQQVPAIDDYTWYDDSKLIRPFAFVHVFLKKHNRQKEGEKKKGFQKATSSLSGCNEGQDCFYKHASLVTKITSLVTRLFARCQSR